MIPPDRAGGVELASASWVTAAAKIVAVCVAVAVVINAIGAVIAFLGITYGDIAGLLTREVSTIHVAVAIVINAIAASFIRYFSIAAVTATIVTAGVFASVDAALAAHVIAINVAVAIVIDAVAACFRRFFSKIGACVYATVEARKVFTVGETVVVVVQAVGANARIIAFVPLLWAYRDG